jgi:geranylgeranyl pyrophosphate synthase
MDEKNLEILWRFFLNAAKGQKGLDDLMRMSRKGFKGFEEMASMFRKFYGLENLEKDAPEYMRAWEKASEEFQKSFREYLNIMGVIPKDDYLEIVRKYEDLKKKVADQEETIRHLQLLLGKKSIDQGETTKVFQDLMKKQSEQFMEMMDAVGGYFKEGKNDSDDKGEK